MKYFSFSIACFVVLSMLLLLPPLYAQPLEWTLERCIAEALVNSHELATGRQEILAREAALEQSQSILLPQLDLNASYRYVSEVMEIDIPAIGPIDPAPMEFGDGNTYDVGLSVRSPLYQGGTLRNLVRSAQEELSAQQSDLSADSLQIIYSVRRAYFTCLGADARLQAFRISLEHLQRLLNEVDGLIEAGVANEEARLEIESNIRIVEQNLSEASAQARQTRLLLGNALGYPREEIVPQDAYTNSLLQAEAISSDEAPDRPEVNSLQTRLQQLDYQRNAARGSFLPSITAQAGYNYGKPGINQMENEWMGYASVGIQMQWTLWDFGNRSQQVQRIQASRNGLEHSLNRLVQNLDNASSIARIGVEAAQEQVNLAEQRVDIEQRRLQLIRNRFQVASATQTEVLDAEDDLREAQIALVAATTQLRMAEVELLYVFGR